MKIHSLINIMCDETAQNEGYDCAFQKFHLRKDELVNALMECIPVK